MPDVFLLDLELLSMPDDKLKVGKFIGEGGFGVVHKATYEGRDIALKSLLKDENTRVEDQQKSVLENFPDYRREVVMTNQMRHPCIIELIGVSIEKLSFAMEFAPLGNLHSLLTQQMEKRMSATNGSEDIFQGPLLDRVLTFKVIFQIFSAVDYLHQKGVIHTDLKTDNIMVFSTDPNECINVKVADYGISQKNVRAGVVRGQAGGHIFVAPEVRTGKAYNEKVRKTTG